MKRLFALFLTLSITLGLCACTRYSDTVDAEHLANVGLQALPNKIEYIKADDGYLDDYFECPEWVLEDEILMAKTASNLNQVGIFHVKEGHADEMKELLLSYLTKSYADNKAWYDSYIPKETSKLRDAEVRVFGNYATYAILSSDDRTLFFEAVEQELSR